MAANSFGKTLAVMVVSLVLPVAIAGAQPSTPTPSPPAKGKLERLRIAVAPLGWDTNFTWLQSRSGMLDKRPALEYLIGVDRNTGAYIPELAEKWEMAPDGKSWTLTLRKGVKFHEKWGEFTAKDVRHSIFLIAQPESVQTDVGLWRSLMGIGKADSIEDVAKKVEEGVQIVDDYRVILRTTFAAPELVDNLSAKADLVMESKARWDAGGKELYGQKVVGTGPFEFVERKVSSHVLYKRVEKHWRKTPEYKELEFRWVPEGVTRLATLLAEEVHISDVERAVQQDALAKGMKIIPSKLTAIGHEWFFGGLYFATPEKLDAKVPFVDKRVRQAMNMAINRNAIANAILGGRVEPMRVSRVHPKEDSALWPGIYNPEWDARFDGMYGYDPAQAKALLQQAGYGAGFEFTVYLYTLPGLPEIVDIGQAVALDWQAIGLKPKLVEIDFPRVREAYRTKSIHGAVWALRGSANALNIVRIFNKAQGSVVYAYEHPFIEERLEALGKVVDPAERARLLREIGDHKFTEFAAMPMFWLHAEAGVNPKYIAEYTFPGSITGFFTHLEYIKLMP
ncbi:MAG: ABC transporter substrate-binding protein [Nitrospinae bacterium]|nr:ABC transporter substrate-binding protein [Nitrospinota bacterium]